MTYVTVTAEVDLDDVLSDATEEQLIEALYERGYAPREAELWVRVADYHRINGCACEELRELIYLKTGRNV